MIINDLKIALIVSDCKCPETQTNPRDLKRKNKIDRLSSKYPDFVQIQREQFYTSECAAGHEYCSYEQYTKL